jgi:hypothetical protein
MSKPETYGPRARAADAAADLEMLLDRPPPMGRAGQVAHGRAPRLSPSQAAAVIVWLAGAASTYLFIAAALPDAPAWLAALVAGAVQIVLTVGERGITRGRLSFVSIVSIAFDTLLNAGGLYGPMQRLDSTPVGVMLADVTGSASGGGMVTLGLCILLGALIAMAPEELWRRKD